MNKNKFMALKAKKAAQLQKQQQAVAAGPYELSMTFCIDEVNTTIDKYRTETGLQDAEATPEHVAYSVYHGDLIICLKNLLIPLEQEWNFGVDSHYYNAETDNVITVPVQFQMPKMSFKDFRFGSSLSVDRGHGLKTRWRGIGKELDEILMADAPEGYIRVRSEAKLTCVTGFSDYECLKEFNFVKRVIRAQGLEGIKNVNEAINQYKDQTAQVA